MIAFAHFWQSLYLQLSYAKIHAFHIFEFSDQLFQIIYLFQFDNGKLIDNGDYYFPSKHFHIKISN